MIDITEKMKTEMFRRKYSIQTIKAYCYCINRFLKKLKKDDLRRITKGDVKDYLNTLHKYSGNTINVNLQALKFMMEEVLHKRCYVHIHFSKTPLKEQAHLTKEEISRLFEAIENKKHKLMIRLLYSAGLRVSELVHLRIRDICLEENVGMVVAGKGNKDRPFIIAEKIKGELSDFIRENRLAYDDYLFKGRNGHLSQRTVQEITKQAAKRANITKNVHPHTMRHSFTNHLFEKGEDALAVQSLLGHKDVKTTMHYAHVARPKITNVKSPLDSW